MIMYFMDKETKSPAYMAHMAARTAQCIAKTKARERLESAAPDMLAALEAAAVALSYVPEAAPVLEDVRAAIRKAKGE